VLAYTARRIGFSVFVLWGAVTVVFGVLRLVPGDPALLLLGSDATDEEIAAKRHELGFDVPLPLQYWRFLLDAARGDFGDSVRLGGDAMGHVLDRMPITTALALVAIAASIAIGVALGILTALRAGRLTDRIVTSASLLTQSLPTFWVGLAAILLFSRVLKILPSGGADTPCIFCFRH
jgi:ABC-type dipeptide/oligopeptide/nickel transport system permease component